MGSLLSTFEPEEFTAEPEECRSEPQDVIKPSIPGRFSQPLQSRLAVWSADGPKYDGIPYDDLEHLERLQISWLEQFPESQQKEIFLSQILPVIAFRMDSDHSNVILKWPVLEVPGLDSELTSWLGEFNKRDFDLKKVMGGYKIAPLRRLQLWRLCPEFYLLALAYSQPVKTTQQQEAFNYHAKGGLSRYPTLQSLKSGSVKARRKDLPKDKLAGYKKFLSDCQSEMKEEQSKMSVWDAAFEAGPNTKPSKEDKSLDERIWYNMKIFLHKRAKMECYHYSSREPIDPREGDMYRWQQVLNLGSPRSQKDTCVWPGEAVQTGVWEIYNEGPWDSHHGLLRDRINSVQNSEWVSLSSNIRNFCQKAASLPSALDPLENIDHLRAYLSKQMVYTPDLDAKVELLASQKEEQERIIISLSYRHLIERLAGKLGEKERTKDKWAAFWEDSWAKAEGNPGHPLFALREKYSSNAGQMKKRGALMYEALSADIHQYLGGNVIPRVGMWGTQDYDILMALTPSGGLNSDYGPSDWEALRKMYEKEKEGSEEIDMATDFSSTSEDSGGSSSGFDNPFPDQDTRKREVARVVENAKGGELSRS